MGKKADKRQQPFWKKKDAKDSIFQSVLPSRRHRNGAYFERKRLRIGCCVDRTVATFRKTQSE